MTPEAARDNIMARVFISYCREDFAEVARLRDALVAEGFEVWWDNDLLPGQDWKYEIREAIKRSSAVILCLSARALERTRTYIYPEALDAIAAYRQCRPGEIFLIPVRLSQCEIPSIEIDHTRNLDRLHCVDLFPTNRWEAGIRKIAESIGPAETAAPRPRKQEVAPEPYLERPVPIRRRRGERHVFLSYSSQDKAVGEEMCAALEKKGIPCWIARRDIEPGKRYAAQIVDAIVGSRAFVLVFSSNSNTSKHVIREVDKAVREGISIIPFRIENVSPSKDMDYLISISQWIDACTPPLAGHFSTLARTLLTLNDEPLERRPEPPPASRTGRLMFYGACVAVASIAVGCLAYVILHREPKRVTSDPGGEQIVAVRGQENELGKALEAKKTVVDPPLKTEERPSGTGTGVVAVAKSSPEQPKAQPVPTTPKTLAETTAVKNERIALEHYQQGARLFKEKKTAEAELELRLTVQNLQSLNEHHPKLAEAYNLLGDVYYQMSKYGDAIRAYSDSIACKDSGPVRHARGMAYVQIGLSQYDNAMKDLTKAINLEDGKGQAEFHHDRANLLARKRHFLEANAGYDRATQLDTRSARAFDDWGRCLMLAGETENAIKKFTEAIKLDSHADFLVDRGNAYVALGAKRPEFGKYDKAIEDYSEAIRSGRKDARVYLRRGDAYWANYLDRLAIDDYTEVLRLVAKGDKAQDGIDCKQRAYFGRGRSYLRQAKVEKALQDANSATALDPTDPKARDLLLEAQQAKAVREMVK
jgi:tetratricopeptide (TPR) repeat protein